MKYIDLHIHTTYSDGTLSPADIVTNAHHAGLSAIAITDHDTWGGLPEARKASRKYNMEIIRGIECSTNACKGKLHILGYYVNPMNTELRDVLRKVRKARFERLLKICDKLSEMGLDVDCKSEFSKNAIHSLGRPHIAMYLKEKGYVKSLGEAFGRYLGDDKPAFIEKWAPDPREIIEIIHNAGGLAVLAHPGATGKGVDNWMRWMLDAGLDGIEALYPTHSPSQQDKYRNFANQNGLVITGGSDFHGEHSDKNLLGIFKVKYPHLEALKKRHRENFGESAKTFAEK
ncbi:MAG: PHP domain-containing protein [Candidatus Zixiibacteriota bacterium]